MSDLIYVLLSRQTTERNFKAAYSRLKRRCRNWNQLATLKSSEIYEEVAIAGFGRQRAKELRTIALRLRADFGRVTLSPLRTWQTPEAESYLTSLPGVGKKTARCVLMYAFDRKVFPVDVHCYRILNRLGLINCAGPVRKHEDLIQDRIPPDLRLALHVNLVSLGRDVCHSTSPECGKCPMQKLCLFAADPKQVGTEASRKLRRYASEVAV
ncbi:MAG TPA: hypothetical protein VGG46_10580 [Terriglobales bacterium]|jgi:endonuclease III